MWWHTEQVVITSPLLMLLPEDCRCFAVPCPDTDSMYNWQQHPKQDCYRIKALFVSWDWIIPFSFTVFGQYIMAHSLLLICLWSKDVGLLLSSFLELKIILLSFPSQPSKCPCALSESSPLLELQSVVHLPRKKLFSGETYFSSLDFIQLNRLKDNQLLS